MKSITIIIVQIGLFVFGIAELFAQQQFHFSQYMINPYVLNPAVGGTSDALDLKLGYRSQWQGFDGAPASYYFTGHTPLRIKSKPDPTKKIVPFHSVGALIYQDEAGPLRRLSALASYGYNLPLTPKLRLAMGLFAGVLNISIDQSKLNFGQDDEVLSYDSKTVPDASAGVWLHGDHFFLGLSSNHLFFNELNFITDSNDEKDNLTYHFHFIHGYNIPLGYAGRQGYDYYMVPSVLVKYAGSGTSPSADINLKVFRKDLMWLGASYRHKDAVAMLFGMTLFKNNGHALELGYSYDYTLSNINVFSNGSHEIVLSYKIQHKQGVLCPDNFW
ncbi:type IX secretion system membrane protein PorP/SprF [Fulvivirga ulvae]|uniref:PorP/SprF family type IX secretion system membrane protein n=1 Tax=Fulvivirga ulvae TaxID=2904245 RepID=UPI001F1E7B79|nr:type IX secretion system membrane protein PorP/SprF [Fulvivirga ulvae]UII32047.1 type IX secretion system membrane protein PorP/SprF [Fulvivirga ulvae]